MLRALLRRRPTRTELAVAAMAVLLGVLAVLQYRWVGQLSTDERERLRSHADNQAENLTEEFNRELTRAFFWLQVGPELRRDAPLEAEVDRYARWYTAAPRPELVKTIYRLTEPPAETGAWTIERFNREPARLEVVAWPTELEPMRAHLQQALEAQRRGTAPVRLFSTFAAVPALLIPRMGQFQENRDGRVLSTTSVRGFTVAVLDRAYLEKDLLPQLVERHFRLSQDPTVYVGVYGPGGLAFTAPSGAGAGVAADGSRRHRRRHVRGPVLRVPALRHRSPGRAGDRCARRRRRRDRSDDRCGEGARRPPATTACPRQRRHRHARGAGQRVPRPRRPGRPARA